MEYELAQPNDGIPHLRLVVFSNGLLADPDESKTARATLQIMWLLRGLPLQIRLTHHTLTHYTYTYTQPVSQLHYVTLGMGKLERVSANPRGNGNRYDSDTISCERHRSLPRPKSDRA